MLGDRDAAEALENFGSRLGDIDLSTLKKLGKMKSALDEADFYTQLVPDLAPYCGVLGVGANVARFAAVQVPKHISDRGYQQEQARISHQLMSAVTSTLQDYSAENYQSAKQQYYTLSYVPMHLLTSKHQSEITQLQQQAAAKMSQYGWVSHTQDIQRIIDSQAAATQYRNFIKMFSSDTKNYRTQLDLSSIQQTLASTSSSDMVLSEDVSRVKAFLEKSQLALGDAFYQLLEADEEKKAAVLTAVEYLEAENKKVFVSQQREQLFDYLGKGFVILDKVADVVAVPALKKVAALGLNGVIITDAVMKLASGVVGVACLDPIFSVAMASAKLYEVFFQTKGPTQLDLIQEQLDHISSQVVVLHKEMRSQFQSVHRHLSNIELMIKSSVHSLTALVRQDVVYRLTSIQSDLLHLTNVTKDGFRDLFVEELEGLESRVASICSGIMPAETTASQSILDDLNSLSQWIKRKSFSRHVTGLLLFSERKDGTFQQDVTEKQFCDYVASMLDKNLHDMLFSVALTTAQCEGWGVDPFVRIPNLELWQRALASYLQLRSHAPLTYDYEEIELGEIHHTYNQLLSDLSHFYLPRLCERILESLVNQLNNIQNQYSDLKVVANKRRTHIQGEIRHDVPSNMRLSDLALEKIGVEKRTHIDLEKNQTVCRDILLWIDTEAKRKTGDKSIHLFSPEFLLAEREGLLRYEVSIARSTASVGDQDRRNNKYCFKCQDIAYGVNITVTIVGTDKSFKLTSASSGVYATWREEHSEKCSLEDEMVKKTEIHTPAIRIALQSVKDILNAHYAKQESDDHYKRILNRLNGDDSFFYLALKHLHILSFCQKVSGYDAKVDQSDVSLKGYVDRMLLTFIDMKNDMDVYSEGGLLPDASSIEHFFEKLSGYQSTLSKIGELFYSSDITRHHGIRCCMSIKEFIAYREVMNKKQEIETAARAGSSILSGGGLFKPPVTSSGMACLFSLASLVVCSLLWLSPTVEQADTACRTVAPLAADEGELRELSSSLSYFEAGVCLLFIMGLSALLGYLVSQRQPNFAPR